CAAPLHDAVRATIEATLGEPLSFDTVGTPSVLRVSLAAISGTIPGAVDESGLFGTDAAELRALEAELEPRVDVARVAGAAREEGLSPLEHVEASGGVSPTILARVRARLYGLSLAPWKGSSAAGLLPPRFAHAHGVTVVHRGTDAVVLAAPRPTPRLAQEVVSLLAPLKVAWAVHPHTR
ncbi:MAG TPA: hypothetical protein VF765_34415, partial [Polyangiaceae bacterium]